jgi:5-methylcytosine-specific restriction enzyme subunit McrC
MAGTLTLNLEDSRPDQKRFGVHVPWYAQAINCLNHDHAEGKIRYISLSGKPLQMPALGSLIDYRFTSYRTVHRNPLANELHVDVSHIIGSYTTYVEGWNVEIVVTPRWGNGIISHLLRYTTGIHSPPSPSGGSQKDRDSAEWLLVLAWVSTFHQAMRRSHIPKEYRIRHSHGPFFRGRLNVARQIRDSISDASRFHCVDAPLTADTTINRTIRCVFRLLSAKRAYRELLRGAIGYDQQLAGFGVADADVAPERIRRICYTRMTSGYRPLMELSCALLQRYNAKHQTQGNQGISFFIDIAELWENYLYAILVRELPPGYTVHNPNERGGEGLFTDGSRHIRPDLIVLRKGIPVAVIDAKFKAYRRVGRTADHGSVSREDLHQMATYLYHYGTPGRPITGCFVTPVSTNDNPRKTLASQANHHITVVGLPINDAEDTWIHDGRLRSLEAKFVADLLACIA